MNSNKPKDTNNIFNQNTTNNDKININNTTNNTNSTGNKPFSNSIKFNHANSTGNQGKNGGDYNDLLKGSSLLSGGSSLLSGGSSLFGGGTYGSMNSMGSISGVGNLNNFNLYPTSNNQTSGTGNTSTGNSDFNSMSNMQNKNGPTNYNSNNIFPSSTPDKRNQTPFSTQNNGLNSNSGKNMVNLTPSNKIVNRNNPHYNPKATNVKEYSYREDQNLKSRSYMEDMPKIIDQFDTGASFFSLYDGHGGSDPVKYCKDRMPEIFLNSIGLNTTNIEKAFQFAFQKLDDELKFTDSENVGTTATICYIKSETDTVVGLKRILYSANVGDTRCVLLTNNSFKRLSFDHKATEPSETLRIKSAGGMVFNGRAGGQLALSRALGDHALKKYGVSCMPYVAKHVIDFNDKYVIIASDGVWDVITEEEILKLSFTISDADEFADIIVKTSINKGSRDNTSVIVVKL